MKAGEKRRTRPEAGRRRFVDVPVLMTVMTCPSCGAGVEVWTNREDTNCDACGHPLFRAQRRDH